MSNYGWWLILSQVTGSPVMALVLLGVGGWALDQFTLGILPSPLRAYRRWRRTSSLTELLTINPHDRRARFELADLLCDHRRFARALEVLKPNVAAGDSDAATLYLMGRAAYGSGHPREAETFLGESLEQDPEYRMGATLLELGRGRLAAGDVAGAETALRDFCKRRQGTVEGRVLLSQACAARGDQAEADRWRSEAWKEYATAPPFLQRQERWWAWRIRPWRPALLALAVSIVAYGLLQLLPLLRPAPAPRGAAMRAAPQGGFPTFMAAPGMSAEAQERYRQLASLPEHPGGGPIDPQRFDRLHFGGLRCRLHLEVDLGERGGPVDGGLARAQPIEVGARDHRDAGVWGRRPHR